MPDSFLAFDEANSYLDKQQRSLDYLDRIQKLSVITKTSIDIKNTNGYNRAVYINKLNHLSKLPTTSIVFTNKLRSGTMNADNVLASDNFWKLEDLTIYSDTMDDRNREIEQAKKLIDESVHSNTAKFVNTKEEKDEEY